MNIKEIKEMIALMNENGLAELEIEKDGTKIRLKKVAGGAVERVVITEPQPAQGVAQKEERPAESPTIEIKAPMVGTFYRSPSPDAPPFVNVGDVVEPGQVVCIIEAMKLMNEIKAEVGGKIVNVPVDNAEPVEYGHILFVLEPVE